ncbi:unnamed protein product [Rhodiola kirilowii]
MASLPFSHSQSHHARTSAALDTTSPSSLPLPIMTKSLKPSSLPLPIMTKSLKPILISASSRRIVAVGDILGDLHKARCALEIARVLAQMAETYGLVEKLYISWTRYYPC